MRRIFLFVVALMASLTQAQNATKAKALLDEVYKKVTSYNNIYMVIRISSILYIFSANILIII